MLEETDSHFAWATHLDWNYHNFNVKAEYIYFNHNARTDNDNPADVVKMTAYGVNAYDVAAKGSMYVVGASYSKEMN